jgi:hypothetical protein
LLLRGRPLLVATLFEWLFEHGHSYPMSALPVHERL